MTLTLTINYVDASKYSMGCWSLVMQVRIQKIMLNASMSQVLFKLWKQCV